MELGKKQLDIVILVTFFFISTLFVWKFKLNNLITTFLYLIVPSIYLLIRYERFRKRILVFALPLGIVLSIAMQYIADYNKVWIWPIDPSLPTIFTHVPLESFLWFPAWAILLVAIYQIFFDFTHSSQKPSKNYKWFIVILFGYFLAFTAWLSIGSPRVEYAYARFFALPAIGPLVFVLIKSPALVPRFFKFSLVMLIFLLIYEIIGLRLRHWAFPGEYSSLVNIFGISIPIEEFVIWIALGGASLASYFETFMDDLK